jgi:Uncharacterized conserved protein (DUF2163)/Phage conserved hypothetical protein BR0599
MKNYGLHPVAGDQVEFAELYTFTLTDGTILRYTSYDLPFLVRGPGGGTTQQFGGVNYGTTLFSFATGPVIKRTRLTSEIGLTPSELTITIASKPTDVAQPYLGYNWPLAFIKKLFDWAVVQVWRLYGPFTLNAAGQVTNGGGGIGQPMPIFKGYVSELISASRENVQFKCLDARSLFNTQIPRNTISPYCRWTLFGAGCTLNAENYGVNTSALAGSTASVLLAALTQDAGYFDLGYVKFLSGQNQGQTAPVAMYLPPNTTYSSLVLQAKPLCYLRMNETTGTTAHDSSGNGNNGTISGPVTLGQPSLIVGDASSKSFLFNPSGGDGQVALNSMSAPNGGRAPLSIEFIIKYTGASNAVFETGPGLPGSIRCYNGLNGFDCAWLDQPDLENGITLEYAHVVLVFYDSRQIALYINGYLYATYSSSRDDQFDWSTFTIGQCAANNVGNLSAINLYDAQLQEFAIYDYPLDGDTVLEHALIAFDGPTLTSAAQITLLTSLPATPAVGDAFRIYPGGDLTYQGCCVKYNNTPHWGGFTNVPDQETAL